MQEQLRALIAVLAMAFISCADAQQSESGVTRRVAPRGTVAGSPGIPAHNLGALLASTDLYDLYEYRSYKGWCANGNAAISILYKVEPDFVIDLSEAAQERFSGEVFPVVRARCSDVKQISVFNYVKGSVIGSNGEFGYQDAASVKYERPLSNFQISVDAQGTLKFPERGFQYVSLADYRQQSARLRKWDANREAEVERIRNAQLATEEKIANSTRSADGLLRLDGIATDHKKLFLKIYDEEFIDLMQPDSEHYLPYQMYTALIQGYDKHCRKNLVDPVAVDFYDERTTHVVHSPLFDTEYSEKYLIATVYVERKYEVAYRTAHSMFLTRLGQYFARKGGDNIILFYLAQSTRGIGLAMASHDLVALNGCNGKGLMRFMSTLHRYVTGNWSTRTADGYKYSESETFRSIERRYEGVPPTFSPEFSVYERKQIVLYLNDGGGQDGLRFVTIEPFSLSPFYLKQHERSGFKPPAFVQAAIDERRYQIARCDYVYGNEGRMLFFWNANAPLPSAEVRAYTKAVIDEPRRSCPANAK